MKGSSAGYVTPPAVTGRFQPAVLPLLISIDEFEEDPDNVRIHPDQNLTAIRASLETFGQTKPIVFRREGGRSIVIAGNGTLRTARALGWTHIAAVEFSGAKHLASAYAIADNRVPELAIWDTEALNVRLEEIASGWSAEGLEWQAETVGLTPDFLKIPAKEAPREKAGERERTPRPEPAPSPHAESPSASAPSPKPAQVEMGTSWTDGPHKIMCGDPEDPEHVARLLANAEVGLVHIDPSDTCRFDLDLLNVWNAARPFLAPKARVFLWGAAPDIWRFWFRHLERMEPLTFHAEVVLDVGGNVLRALCFSVGADVEAAIPEIWAGTDVLGEELVRSEGNVYSPFGPTVLPSCMRASRDCFIMGKPEDWG